jgi:SHS2 domain-containing protein
VQAVDTRRLSAEVAGEPYDPARHRLRGEVKAITWHELGIVQVDGGWRARVILDV